jgi:hypothetical protein
LLVTRGFGLLVAIPTGALCFVLLAYAVRLVGRDDLRELASFLRGSAG